jgi:hypothetical protein
MEVRALGLCLLLAGCELTPASGRFACDLDADCPPGQRCADGRCVRPGSGTRDAAPADAASTADAGAPDAAPTTDAAADGGVDPCAALDCGVHGTCSVEADAARCACPPGYAGPRCETCAPGWDPVADRCELAPIVADPELDAPGAWQTEGATSVAGGVARIDGQATCEGGAVWQTVRFPDALPGPLALRVRYRGASAMRLTVAVDDDARDLGFAPADALVERSFCLDAALAGRTVRLALEPTYFECLTWDEALEVDAVDIRPAAPAECPGGGEVPNGDFEAGARDWEVLGEPGSGAGLDGIHGGRGARLVPPAGGVAHLMGSVRLPTRSDVPHPALALWQDGVGRVSVRVEEHLVGGFEATSDAPVRVCLPPWMAGRRAGLELAVEGGGGVDFDDLRVVDEPGCDWARGVAGGGFEPMGEPSLVRPIVVMDGAAPGPRSIERAIVSSPADAYRGSSALRVGVDACERRHVLVEVHGRVPPADSVGGPALVLATRAGAWSAGATADVHPFLAGGPGRTLSPAAAWTEEVLCLDPRLAGRAMGYAIQLADWSGCGGGGLSELWVDELRFDTSADCPR